jgi:hypothetical protein
MMTYARKLRIYLLASIVLIAFTTDSMAQNNDVEIEYLLTSVGSSNCTFIRNGTEHSSTSAESHLRMKYEKTRRYIDNAEEFIDKLASESSWTGKAYTLDCPSTEAQATRTWLLDRLTEYRAAN